MRPLKWTSKSRRKISTELQRQGWQVSAKTVGKILRGKLDYSLQGLQKTREGASHPDRDAQFQYLNQQCQDFQHRGQPGFSVDAKKKELIGDFQNGGREWAAGRKAPNRCGWHDFEDKQLGKGISLRRVGSGPQRGRGQCRDPLRHGPIRGGLDPPVVDADGRRGLSAGSRVAHHGRCRRQQRLPNQVVETGAAAAGRRNGSGDHGLSLSARNQQVE